MTQNDCGMVLVGVILGDRNLEFSIHKMFGKYHRHGEWFYPADELVRYIKQNRDPSVQKIIETIRDIGSGRKEAIAQIVDLDLPIGEGDWLPLPVIIPEGHPGDNYDYRMKGFFDPSAQDSYFSDRDDCGQDGNIISQWELDSCGLPTRGSSRRPWSRR